MADVKELKEAIQAAGEVMVLFKKVMKDGKIGLDDILTLTSADLSVIMAGVNGMNQIPEEVKDIDADEAKEVLILLADTFKKGKAA